MLLLRLLKPVGYIPPAEARENTTGNLPARQKQPDSHQLAFSKSGAVQFHILVKILHGLPSQLRLCASGCKTSSVTFVA
jgi:hypothetical protein